MSLSKNQILKLIKQFSKVFNTNDHRELEHIGTLTHDQIESEISSINLSKFDKNTDTLDSINSGLINKHFTQDEKTKLADLEGSKFKGQYSSLVALQTAYPTADIGSYAYVDEGVGEPNTKYIWDNDDEVWTKQLGEAAEETPATIKQKYESNLDTNAFTDAEQSKLSNINQNSTIRYFGTPNAIGSARIINDGGSLRLQEYVVDKYVDIQLGKIRTRYLTGLTQLWLDASYDESVIYNVTIGGTHVIVIDVKEMEESDPKRVVTIELIANSNNIDFNIGIDDDNDFRYVTWSNDDIPNELLSGETMMISLSIYKKDGITIVHGSYIKGVATYTNNLG